MRVSVIGCGNISKCHLSVLDEIDDVEIVSVADILPERADSAAVKYNCRAYYDYINMLDEEKPDCVHICTPHYLHVEMSLEALSRGINVLCEKPCAINEEDLQKLRLACLMSDAQFGVCFQNRYNGSVITVKKLLDEKKYGNIKAVRASVHWYRTEKYYNDDWHGSLKKEGGGVLVNQAIHTFDLMRYLAGSNIRKLTGHVFNDALQGIIETEDSAHVRMEFSNGIIGFFDASVSFAMNADIIVDIFCDDALLRIEGNNAYVIINGKCEQIEFEKSDTFVGLKYWGNGHNSLINDFYDCLKSGRKFLVDANEGGKAVEEFLAVYKSSASGKEVEL